MNQTIAQKKRWLFVAVAILGVALFAGTESIYATEPQQNASNVKVNSESKDTSFNPSISTWDMDSYDPFAEMERMQEQMNRMFNASLRHTSSLFGPGPVGTGIPRTFFEPNIDLQDKNDHYLITMDIPGMDKDQINVAVKDRMLTISGERKSESEKKDEKKGFYRMERHFGSFSRSVPLPDDANPENMKASYDQGVLKIEIAKLPQKQGEESKVKKIPVK